MPKRRRGPVDDSEEDSDVSDGVPKSEIQNDPPMGFPVVLKTGQSRKRARRGSDDDEEYVEEQSSSEEDPSASSDAEFEFSDGGFVVDSDDNADRKGYRNQNRRRRGAARRKTARPQQQSGPKRGRGRPRRRAAVESDSSFEADDDSDDFDVSEGSIAEELRELRGSENKERKHNFRERQPVNYIIPPPPTIEEVARAKQKEAELTAAAKSKDTRPRRLFEVSGPFGGHGVHTIFNVSKSELKAVISHTPQPHLGGSGYSTGSPLALNGADGGAANGATGAFGNGFNGAGNGGAALGAANGGNDADVDPIEVSGVDFSMVGGLDGYIAKLKEMVSLPLLYPELYEKFGITPPRGVLFHGPPGTGKTLMARALAASHKQEKVTFYMRKGADILSKWIGESERQLRALFDEARAHQPSIIFFDEIDGLAPVRSAKQEQHHASIVSTLLALMDGMDNRGQVVVIGATNRPDSVDPALRRPGRFDREFYFPLPDFDAREKILEIHTRLWDPKPSKDLLKSIAKQTKGYGGADLRALTTEAALLAINRAYPQIYGSNKRLRVDPGSIQVRAQDFTLALERVQPSTARTAGVSLAQPIPARVEPLLRDTFRKVTEKVKVLFPNLSREAKLSALFLDEQKFDMTMSVSKFQQHRIYRPRLLLTGPAGNGQGYIAKAISNLLEGVYVRELSTSLLFQSGVVQPESALVNAISEVRQRSPACLLLSSLSDWATAPHLVSLLSGLLRSFSPDEPVFVVASDEIEGTHAEQQILSPLLDFFNDERIELKIDTSKNVLNEFFAPVLSFIYQNPAKCLEAHELPRPPLPELEQAEENKPKQTESKESLNAMVIEDQTPKQPSNARVTRSGPFYTADERKELRIRSQLKIKLGLILDGFRQKYRRFRKPVIDEAKLAYLFEEPIERFKSRPTSAQATTKEGADSSSTAGVAGATDTVADTAPTADAVDATAATASDATAAAAAPDNNGATSDPVAVSVTANDDAATTTNTDGDVVVMDEEDDDEEHPFVISEDNRILEKSTGKRYFNMDLETVEDRLWNGFYCVPEQFLNDIEMIYCDAVEFGERERMHKASEMLANAQVAIDDINMDKQFVSGCVTVHTKDAQMRLSELEKSADSGDAANTTEATPVPVAEKTVEHEHAIDNGLDASVVAKETILENKCTPLMTQEEYNEQINKSVSLDMDKYKLFETLLLEKSANFTLERLEAMFATLSDISWQYRLDLDRNKMVDALIVYVKSVD